MYKIVKFDERWVVCTGQAMVLAFDQEDAAIRTVNEAEKLMQASARGATADHRQPTTVAWPRYADTFDYVRYRTHR